MAKQSKPPASQTRVRLLVAHTGIGKPGEIVTLPAAKAVAHENLGLLEILDAGAKSPKPPEPTPPADAADAAE